MSMTRINVYDYSDTEDGVTLAGWFALDSAERYAENTRWDGNNQVSLVTGSQWNHEALYYTKGGRWVRQCWSQWQGSAETNEFVTDDQARTWLLRNNHDAVVELHFGPIEEERNLGGRPEVGPAISIRLPKPLLDKVDEWADKQGATRAGAIRVLLTDRLADLAD